MYSYRVYNPNNDLPVATFNTFDEAAALIERPGYENFVIEEKNLDASEPQPYRYMVTNLDTKKTLAGFVSEAEALAETQIRNWNNYRIELI